MSRPRRSYAFVWKTLLLIVALLLNVTLFSRILMGSYNWKTLKDQKAQLSEELDKLNARRMALSREIRLLKTDPAYVEKVIRQRLNYVHKNEILYLFEREKQNSLWKGTETDGKP
ncbi:septum formation initiator family protein [uncultured Mailhella sp.]|uniref:FtsB family cell division protein n=1 Tax=uncultured Mailhella sp. TaxID=1981031 RepID=UPI0026168AF3|nr:septum formation initiator family protein [uncultured Mailhella sp.]